MNSNSKLSYAIAAILGVNTTMGAVAAYAGTDAESGSGSANRDEISEIIVTATRRSENLQDVPIAITALTGEVLAQLNIQTFEDYVKYLPNVSSAAKGPGQNELYMRGLSTSIIGNQAAASTASFPNVAVYL